jgi:hypothetical protein
VITVYEWTAPSGVRVVSEVPQALEGGWLSRLYQTMRHRIYYTVTPSKGKA